MCQLSLAALVIAVAPSARAQSSRPQFEVASIKRNLSTQVGGRFGQLPDRFDATHVNLWRLISLAYRVQFSQIVGGPEWADSDFWDVQGKAEDGSIPNTPRPPSVTGPPDSMALMLQTLLEDRFHLRVHREEREMPVYELHVAKAGSKMRLSLEQNTLRPDSTNVQRGGLQARRGMIEGTPLPNLVEALSQQLDRRVIDKTGLNGLYDFGLKWMPDEPPDPLSPGAQLPPPDRSAPSLVTALQEQLGLKLESSKGPVEVLVIDSISKPTEN